MKATDLINIIGKAEVLKRNLVCRNVKHFYGYGSATESDLLSLNKNDYLTEFEIKISRSDFLADKKKKRWEWFKYDLKYYFPNYFYYVVPFGMITALEMPKHFGLIYVTETSASVIQKAGFLHKDKWNRAKVLEKFMRVTCEREYLGCCLMTHKNREIEKRNAARGGE